MAEVPESFDTIVDLFLMRQQKVAMTLNEKRYFEALKETYEKPHKPRFVKRKGWHGAICPVCNGVIIDNDTVMCLRYCDRCGSRIDLSYLGNDVSYDDIKYREASVRPFDFGSLNIKED